jgi:hypothetical protein
VGDELGNEFNRPLAGHLVVGAAVAIPVGVGVSTGIISGIDCPGTAAFMVNADFCCLAGVDVFAHGLVSSFQGSSRSAGRGQRAAGRDRP